VSPLIADALLRVTQIQQHIGVFALVVDAKDESSKAFYEHHGFQPLLDDPARLFLANEMIRIWHDAVRCGGGLCLSRRNE
jgi:hypothetical protein